MKSRIIGFIFRVTGIGPQIHALLIRQKMLETQLDFLLRNTNRKIRRKWYRALTRKKSPFYIGDMFNKE